MAYQIISISLIKRWASDISTINPPLGAFGNKSSLSAYQLALNNSHFDDSLLTFKLSQWEVLDDEEQMDLFIEERKSRREMKRVVWKF